MLRCNNFSLDHGYSMRSVKIKKYANRRLYDTEKSAYITLGELAEMVRSGVQIEVRDARNNSDLTRATLVQIILEIETEGHQMLPIDALRQIIMAYDSENEALFSRYLERTMSAFRRHQQAVQSDLHNSIDVIAGTVFDTPATPTQKDLATPSQYASLRAELDVVKAKLDQLIQN